MIQGSGGLLSLTTARLPNAISQHVATLRERPSNHKNSTHLGRYRLNFKKGHEFCMNQRLVQSPVSDLSVQQLRNFKTRTSESVAQTNYCTSLVLSVQKVQGSMQLTERSTTNGSPLLQVAHAFDRAVGIKRRAEPRFLKFSLTNNSRPRVLGARRLSTSGVLYDVPPGRPSHDSGLLQSTV